jgi:hypothetical protein
LQDIYRHRFEYENIVKGDIAISETTIFDHENFPPSLDLSTLPQAFEEVSTKM